MSQEKATKATYIKLVAQKGQEQNLETLLSQAASIIRQTEPKTIFWTALKSESDERTFAVFDTFSDESGRTAHFNGKALAAFKEKADEYIEGGWEHGVLPNIHNFSIVSCS